MVEARGQRKKLTWDVLDDLSIFHGRRHLEMWYTIVLSLRQDRGCQKGSDTISGKYRGLRSTIAGSDGDDAIVCLLTRSIIHAQKILF